MAILYQTSGISHLYPKVHQAECLICSWSVVRLSPVMPPLEVSDICLDCHPHAQKMNESALLYSQETVCLKHFETPPRGVFCPLIKLGCLCNSWRWQQSDLGAFSAFSWSSNHHSLFLSSSSSFSPPAFLHLYSRCTVSVLDSPGPGSDARKRKFRI